MKKINLIEKFYNYAPQTSYLHVHSFKLYDVTVQCELETLTFRRSFLNRKIRKQLADHEPTQMTCAKAMVDLSVATSNRKPLF